MITQSLYNAYCTPKSFFVDKYFESWDPKFHGPCNYIQSFYVAAFIEEFVTKKHYLLEMFRNSIPKNTRSSYKGTMNDGTTFSSSDSEMASKVKPHLKKIEDELLFY